MAVNIENTNNHVVPATGAAMKQGNQVEADTAATEAAEVQEKKDDDSYRYGSELNTAPASGDTVAEDGAALSEEAFLLTPMNPRFKLNIVAEATENMAAINDWANACMQQLLATAASDDPGADHHDSFMRVQMQITAVHSLCSIITELRACLTNYEEDEEGVFFKTISPQIFITADSPIDGKQMNVSIASLQRDVERRFDLHMFFQPVIRAFGNWVSEQPKLVSNIKMFKGTEGEDLVIALPNAKSFVESVLQDY